MLVRAVLLSDCFYFFSALRKSHFSKNIRELQLDAMEVSPSVLRDLHSISLLDCD